METILSFFLAELFCSLTGNILGLKSRGGRRAEDVRMMHRWCADDVQTTREWDFIGDFSWRMTYVVWTSSACHPHIVCTSSAGRYIICTLSTGMYVICTLSAGTYVIDTSSAELLVVSMNLNYATWREDHQYRLSHKLFIWSWNETTQHSWDKFHSITRSCQSRKII